MHTVSKFDFWCWPILCRPGEWRQQSKGAVNQPATHRGPCHHKETAVPISSLNVSDWNLEAHKRSSQMRLFCKIYLDCHSQWCALLRRCAALGLWLSASCHTISLSCFVNLSNRTRDMWREAAELKFWTTSPVNAIFRAQNFSKTKIRKVSYLKTSYSGENSIKAFTLGVTSSRLYAWDVQHWLLKRNEHKQQWYSLGVQRLLTNHKSYCV